MGFGRPDRKGLFLWRNPARLLPKNLDRRLAVKDPQEPRHAGIGADRFGFFTSPQFADLVQLPNCLKKGPVKIEVQHQDSGEKQDSEHEKVPSEEARGVEIDPVKKEPVTE